MFRNMKLGMKIASLAVILIAIGAATTFVGYNGLRVFSRRVEDASAVSRLVKEIGTVEKHAMRFVLTDDPSYVDKVNGGVGTLKELTAGVRAGFKDKVNRDQMDQVDRHVDDFSQAFALYADLEEQKDAAMEEMRSDAHLAFDHAEAIYSSLKEQLADGRKKSNSVIDDKMAKAEDAGSMIEWLYEARENETEFILSQGEEKWNEAHLTLMDRIYKLAENLKSRLKEPENIRQIDEMVAALHGYNNAFEQYRVMARQIGSDTDREQLQIMEEFRQEMKTQSQNALDEVDETRADMKVQLYATQNRFDLFLDDKLAEAGDANRMTKLLLDVRKLEKELIITNDPKYKDLADKRIARILSIGEDLKSRFKLEKNFRDVDGVMAAVRAYSQAFDKVADLIRSQEDAGNRLTQTALGVEKVCGEAIDSQKVKMEEQASSATVVMLIGAVAGVVIGAFLALIIIRGITRAINKVIGGLSEGAEQVVSASGQVTGASQSLAEGASEQAASIEETSSSLEEMSSMTHQNADNARQADSLMKETHQAVTGANRSMEELTVSMAEISKASEETSKIVKNIDEIAFQTNLLALNAAVEAARAGEAGAGFAVVADEVRSLAMRSADAAKNTAGLIEGTVKQVKEGSELVAKTNENFGAVASSAAKVGELISEIAAASSEQAQGLGQVNTAVNEVDKVTQQNAANAEESASAAEEMNAQAGQMKEFVADLVALVGSSKKDKKAARGKEAPVQQDSPAVHHPAADRQHGSDGNGHSKKALPVSAMKEISPEELIPLDGDFEDF